MWSTDWCINNLKELDRLTRHVINECSGKHKYESTRLLYLPSEEGGKGLIEIESVYKNTKLIVARYINNSEDPHIKLVKSFQNEKEKRNLRSVFKDGKRYAEELELNCYFEDGATVLEGTDNVTIVNEKEPRKRKQIIHEASMKKRKYDVIKQPWIGKFVTQHWQDPEVSAHSYDIFRQWKNIPDIVMSVDTSIRQQLLNTKIYRSQKLHGRVDDLSCRLCFKDQETVSHVLCGCYHIAQSLYKARHDRMLRPVYHALLERYKFEESEYSNPWYKQFYPQPSQENNEAKILWGIPWKLEKCPMNGANRPDISVLDKKNKEWIIIEGTICNPGKIKTRAKQKKDKYIDLKLGIKNLYSGNKVKLITVVFDFLAVYYKDLEEELTSILDNNLAKTTIERSQKWIISQNCGIVKRFLS